MDTASCLSFCPQLRDFGCGFSFCCILELSFDLVVYIILFVMGLKALDVSWRDFLGEFWRTSDDSGNGLCSFPGVCGVCYSNALSSLSKFEKDSVSRNTNRFASEEEGEVGNVKQVLLGLKKALKIEQERLNKAYIELEEERMSASSAAEAALALILKIQNEKSLIEMEARQYREIAEQKQLYDRQVIEDLGCIISNYESDRRIQEAYLNLSRKRLFAQSLSNGAVRGHVEDQNEQRKRYLMDRDKLEEEEEPTQCEMDDPMDFYCLAEGDLTGGLMNSLEVDLTLV